MKKNIPAIRKKEKETNTVSEKECQRQMVEEFWLQEELKAERD